MKGGTSPRKAPLALPASAANRAYLRSRYIKYIGSAVLGGNAQRIKMLFQSETFLSMSAQDKLIIGNAVSEQIGDVRLSRCFTQGVADCFLEAFIQGLGTVVEFRRWVDLAGAQVTVDALEGFVLHDDVNNAIRAEAITVLFERYTSLVD